MGGDGTDIKIGNREMHLELGALYSSSGSSDRVGASVECVMASF